MYLLLWAKILLLSAIVGYSSPAVEDIVYDIYTQMAEEGDIDYAELQTRLLDLYQNPINLRTCDLESLRQLPFLSEKEIDAIYAYRAEHGIDRMEELRLVSGLSTYTRRNIVYFVRVGDEEPKKPMNARELFSQAHHEINVRADLRNVDHYVRDPFFGQVRYKFNAANRIQFGFTLRREAGMPARDMLYGGYVQLNDFGILRRAVAGNYQANFGCGLVTSRAYHEGKTGYVLNVGYREDGLSKNTSLTNRAYHGVGATLTLWEKSRSCVDLSSWYSLTRENDSVLRHVIGANLTYRRGRLHLGATYVQKIYSDSLKVPMNTYYNRNYFRGKSQAVVGLNARYNWGVVDWFGEVAMAQSGSMVIHPKWGFAATTGARIYPAADISLVALYRYYSPTFDNTLGYGFSESSRIGDEQGGYVAIEVSRFRGWILSGYLDGYYHSGPKFGIRSSGTWGIDGRVQAEWTYRSNHTNIWYIRGKRRADKDRIEGRWRYRYEQDGWTVTSQADIVGNNLGARDVSMSLSQDVEYRFGRVPIAILGRLCGFRVRRWDNRIFSYENDVLYAYSIPSLYGVGGRGYVNLRWVIRQPEKRVGLPTLPGVSLYLRASLTIYSRSWTEENNRDSRTDTDIHSTLRLFF